MKNAIEVCFSPLSFQWVLYLFLGLSCASAAHARQLALVVGIDDYKFGSDSPAAGSVLNLQGAENDARLIARALRSQQVDLPEDRLLLGENATRENFLAAWESLQAEAKTGDTIYITFAGHGGQELEIAEPFDEQTTDAHDETLMFWDFDPERAHLGRITDDELYALFKGVSAQRIVLVADTCHSGGLIRSIGQSASRSRNGGRWQVDVSMADISRIEAAEGENWDKLSHVTYITATADEARTVDEITIGNQRHGALSVSFAEGIQGAADRDGNGLVLRSELEDYITYQVATYSNRLQNPGFIPRGTNVDNTVFTVTQRQPLTSQLQRCHAQQVSASLPIDVSGGAAPEELSGATLAPGAALRFHIVGQYTRVFYELDEVTRFDNDSDSLMRWQWVIDKYRLLRGIDYCFDSAARAISIQLQCESTEGHCDMARPVGSAERLKFLFGQGSSARGGSYLVLFNLAGTGMLQWLYPYPGDRQPLHTLPFVLDGITVSAPAGRDDIVVGLCRNDPVTLIELLKRHDKMNAPAAADFVGIAANQTCQWGRYATFTTP